MSRKAKTLLVLDNFSLSTRGRRLSLEVYSGDCYAVMGPRGAGKSQFLAAILEEVKPAAGRCIPACRAAITAEDPNRRHTPQHVATAAGKNVDKGEIVRVLTALGLWEHRQVALSKLGPEEQMVCDLLPCLLSEEEMGLIDGHLDVLDPWMLDSVLQIMSEQSRRGRAFFVTTNQPGIAQKLGSVIVLREGSPRFAGSVPELIKAAQATQLMVETVDADAVQTMIAPFVISVQKSESGLLVRADKGQDLAAKLLLQGYGRVKSVVVREPSFEEALMALY